MIKVKKRAHIGEDVPEVYRLAAEKTLRQIHQDITQNNPSMGTVILKRKQGDIARLAAILHDVKGAGHGMDLEMTRMRGVDFETIDVDEHNGMMWFECKTKDLIIQTVEGRGRNSRYNHSRIKIGESRNCGDYTVYFPVQDLGTTRVERIHFVPNEEPLATQRHYHQRASDGKIYGVPGEHHPTEMTAHSCWGGFAGPMASCMSACDLTDLIRMCRMFVGRRNPQSILVSHPATEKRDDEEF